MLITVYNIGSWWISLLVMNCLTILTKIIIELIMCIVNATLGVLTS